MNTQTQGLGFHAALFEAIAQRYPYLQPFLELRSSAREGVFYVYLYNQKAFTLTFAKTAINLELPADHLLPHPHEIAAIHRPIGNGSYRLVVDVSFNQDAFLDQFDALEKELRRSAAVDRFGCCHRFEACSDARTCLIKHEYLSLGCYYRENLEAGRIFYGKNRNVD